MTSRDATPHLHRRAFLGQTTGALGSMALAQLLANDSPGLASTTATGSQTGSDSASADSVICLFQHGGPSQMDLFDPKPELTRRHGQPYEGELEVHFHEQMGNILASPFKFAPHGQCGMELSELVPHLGEIADDITLVRSVTTESVDHESALRLIHSGKFRSGHPTWGSWVIYALGSFNDNLPAYVVLADPGGMPVDGVRNWASGWLPAQYQGTMFRSGESPVANLATPAGMTHAARRGQLDFLERINRTHATDFGGNAELEARIANFEVAARMQTAVPEAIELSGETAATRTLYGMDDPATEEYGRRCLIARRLVERGVRFVQLFLASQPWDTHTENAKTLEGLTSRIDQPSAALVKDLQQRGLLDRTIVMWGGEFGRQPISQGKDGRDHNRHANSLWLAGGGFRRGYVHGATDELGYAAVEDVVSVHDLHATLLKALGLDHLTLTYPHDGRPGSLTDEVVTNAKVASQLLA